MKMALINIAVISYLLALVPVANGSIPHHRKNRAIASRHVRGRLNYTSSSRISSQVKSWRQPLHLNEGADWSISPITFGADPTGRNDSTAAFALAIESMLARNTSGHTDESGTYDLGGVLLDLEGGDYLISAPLAIPSNYSNFQIAHGTLRASPSFPPNGYLVQFGTENSPCVNWGDSCNEDGSVEDLLLDGSQVAAGCIQYWAVIGFNAGPDIYCVNFLESGIAIEGGHEVVIHETWVGSCWYTPPDACWLNGTALGSTVGIMINGNDHYISDTIVFAGLVGVQVNGAANMITNVHTWNTQSGSVPAAAGIETTVWQNRFVGVYLDYVPFVCKGCAVTTVTNGFFLGGAQVVFKPHPSGYPVRGVYIDGNQFVGMDDGQQTAVALPAAPGTPSFSSIEDVTISGNMVDNPKAIVVSTVASSTVLNPVWQMSPLQPNSFTLDFTDLLLFNCSDPATPIQTLTFSALGAIYYMGIYQQMTYNSLPPQGCFVTILCYSGGTGPCSNVTSITVTVDQSTRKGPA